MVLRTDGRRQQQIESRRKEARGREGKVKTGWRMEGGNDDAYLR